MLCPVSPPSELLNLGVVILGIPNTLNLLVANMKCLLAVTETQFVDVFCSVCRIHFQTLDFIIRQPWKRSGLV